MLKENAAREFLSKFCDVMSFVVAGVARTLIENSRDVINVEFYFYLKSSDTASMTDCLTVIAEEADKIILMDD